MSAQRCNHYQKELKRKKNQQTNMKLRQILGNQNFKTESLSSDLQRLNLTSSYCIIANQQVRYQCVHTARPEFLLRICEGHSHSMHCFGGSINIIEANYGRLTGGHICPGAIKTTYCGAAWSQAQVRKECKGKQQCLLRATNSVFGDPCYGTKYLEVRTIQPYIYCRL